MAQRSATIEGRRTSGSKGRRLKATLLVGSAFALGFLVLGIVGIQVWEYTNSVSFCTNGCHSTTGWSGASFDHALAVFQLTGAHTGTACTQCHPGSTYKGTPQACVACHAQVDKHQGQFGQDCARCHSTTGWSGAGFDHTLAAFQLTGAHTGTACTQCHPGSTYKGTSQSCVACHAEADRHQGQFDQDCSRCHSTAGWSGAVFDHALAAFQLTGAHTGTACTQCHPGNTYKGTPQACVACHAQTDKHQGQFGQDCAACHSPKGWQLASLDHNETAFALTGAHRETACARCHTDSVFQGTPRDCAACHNPPGFHGGHLGAQCGSCHEAAAWQPARYDRAHTFPINHGEGGASRCQTCHSNSIPAYTCYKCHEHDPAETSHKHIEEGISDFQDCTRCHPTGQESDEGDEDDPDDD